MMIGGSRHVTFDTDVAGREVSHEVLAAGLHVEQSWVWYGDHTALSSGTLAVHVTEDIRRASHKVVSIQTPAQLHAPIPSWLHDDHLIWPACGVELLPLAVLLLLWNTEQHIYCLYRTSLL